MEDIYADQVQVTVGIYGATLAFGATSGEQSGFHKVGVVRCSPQLAKILSLMLRRNIKSLEGTIGQTIGISMEEYRNVGVAEEDW